MTLPRRSRTDNTAKQRRGAGVQRLSLPIQIRRRGHRTEDSLSEQARGILIQGFELNRVIRQIADDLAQIESPIPERTIARMFLRWRAEKQQEDIIKVLREIPRDKWTTEEVLELSRLISVAPGWRAHQQRAIWRAIRKFFKHPTVEQARAIDRLSFAFILSHQISEDLGRGNWLRKSRKTN